MDAIIGLLRGSKYHAPFADRIETARKNQDHTELRELSRDLHALADQLEAEIS